ncbi:hypothetical protein B0H21DRAFT_116009 [Amylocystis lapponica]|nr:hypothetical protein B0H21DRAFT_116009 [Amylocystis lapponica]
MLFRLACRRLPRSPLVHSVRTLASPARSPHRPSLSRLSRIGIASGAILTASVVFGTAGSSIYADAEHPELNAHSGRPPTALSSLVRSYIVYSICSVPTLVDWSPSLLSALFSVPVLRNITQAVVRVTFFDQVRTFGMSVGGVNPRRSVRRWRHRRGRDSST